jgi:hypothetical protein
MNDELKPSIAIYIYCTVQYKRKRLWIERVGGDDRNCIEFMKKIEPVAHFF